MAAEERNYTIPLRKDFIKVPKYYRAKRAVSHVKGFISKHMKVDDVKIGKNLNEAIWEFGIKNPPGKITVKATKEGNTAKVELEGYDYAVEKIQKEKTEKPTGLKEKLAAKMKPEEKAAEEEKKPEQAKEEKEEKGKKAAEKPLKEEKTSEKKK